MNEVALVPFDQVERMASAMSRSGLFNKTPEQMLSLMLIAQAEGIHPAIAAQEYDVIQGRAALKSQAALARFQMAGGAILWLKRTDTEASAKFAHPQGGELVVTWTMERARKMGLADKDNWKKQPAIMLQWRVVAEGVRAIYPACLNRMYLTDEVVDFEPMPAPPDRVVTPEPVEEPLPPAVQAIYQQYETYIASGLLKEAGVAALRDVMARRETNIATLEKGLTKARKAHDEALAAIDKEGSSIGGWQPPEAH